MAPRFLLITVLLCALVPQARADDACNAKPEQVIRLDAPGEPFSKIPIREQGNLGTCYAAVAAQMADYWRLTHGKNPDRAIKAPTSEVHASMLHQITRMPECPATLEEALSMDLQERLIDRGGSFCHAFRSLIESGGCSQTSVERWMMEPFSGPNKKNIVYGVNAFSRLQPASENTVHLSQLLNSFYEPERFKAYCVHKRLSETGGSCSIADDRMAIVGDSTVLLFEQLQDAANLLMPSRKVRLKEAIWRVKSEDEIIGRLAAAKEQLEKAACMGADRIDFGAELNNDVPACFSEFQAEPSMRSDQEWEQLFVDRLTAKKPMPIGFCASAIKNQTELRKQAKEANSPPPPPDNRWFRPAGNVLKEYEHPNCGGHGVILIGMRTCQDGRKQALLRNSWGKEWCTAPSNRLEGSECDGGNLWVDMNVIAKNTITVAELIANPVLEPLPELPPLFSPRK